MRLSVENNPFQIKKAPLHPAKITVWAAFSSHGIIGMVFIKETVTLESYHSLLADNIPELENRGLLKSTIFQQDNAKPHTSDINLLLLRKTFKNREISNQFISAAIQCLLDLAPLKPRLKHL